MPEAWLNQRCNRLLHANFVILNAACIVAVDESKIGPKKINLVSAAWQHQFFVAFLRFLQKNQVFSSNCIEVAT